MKKLNHLILLTISISLMSCAPLLNVGDDEKFQARYTSDIQKFSSCMELKNTTNSANAFYGDVMSVSAAMPNSIPMATEAGYDTQSANVIESDSVQVNSKLIVVLRDESLEILNRATLTTLKTIPVKSTYSRTLFVSETQIIVLLSKNNDLTQIMFFNTVDFKLEKQTEVMGNFKDVRVHDDQMILMTIGYGGTSEPASNTLSQNPKILSPNCQDIYQPQINAYNWSLTLLYNFSLSNLEKAPAMTGFAGYPDIFYMTENSLYLISNSFYQFPSHVRKIVWNASSIQLKAVGTYEGMVKDRWAVQEYKDNQDSYLALASGISTMTMSTSSTVWIAPDKGADSNRIFMLKENGALLANHSVSNQFGHNETIRSVRYLDNLAYVVTFRTVDPLFIFDMSDRKNIRQLGELKVPGFSTHMRSLSSQDLLGVGFDTIETENGGALQQGIQISLFDVTKNEAPVRSQVFTIGARGSSSPATTDAHALLYHQSSGLVALPVIEWKNQKGASPWDYGTIMSFSGAQVYRYQQRQLVEVGRISHLDWREQYNCGTNSYGYWGGSSAFRDIQRLLMLDNQLISVSRFGVKAHDPGSLQVLKQQAFAPDSRGFCFVPYSY